MDCKASDVDDPTVDPRFGRVGKQVIKDTGPLTKKRMEMIDDDVASRSVDFMQRMRQAGKPFFMWVNFTHMHLRTHAKPESIGQSGRWQSPYHDVMIDHDRNVGTVLAKLDEAWAGGRYDRALRHGQWPTREQLAGWRDDAVPQREEYQLGRRVSRALVNALAEQNQTRERIERDHQPS